jgi:hypothetical protein
MKRVALTLLLPLLALGCLWSLWRYVWSIVFNPAKAWNIALMIDQTANVGANGKVDTTISARAARARNAGRRWGCVLCRLLDWVQTDHCDIALKDAQG